MPLRRIRNGIPTPEWRGTSLLGAVLNNFDEKIVQETDVRMRIDPVPATAHLADVHLHDHGESMAPRDLTTGELSWETDAEDEPSRRQIVRIPACTSEGGVPDRSGSRVRNRKPVRQHVVRAG